jgi:hypothetical protein
MRILFLILLTLNVSAAGAQGLFQTLKGIVTDKETNVPLPGANITILNSSPPIGITTDAEGKFRLPVKIGRISLKISFLGYEDLILYNIMIASGKEVELTVSLLEKAFQTSDAIVRSEESSRKTVNQMAIISTNTIRTDDALRYAGGFYDPSRIVNSFAGVVTSNSDVSNDIIIRGNSSRGLLWRLEGVEIPNPNHFSDGQGGSGGAFSAITSNVVDNFDFYTGAFPAEFGNAISGVMDLNLRKGNSDTHEYAFQTGMIGAEISMEGPFSKKKNASFLLNARYTNFKMLSDLKIIDLGETNFAPRTKDLAFNINLPGKKAGSFNLFGVLGSSQFGKIAMKDLSKWSSLSDQWEEMENQSFTTIGIKHLFSLTDSKTYIKTVLAYTSYSNSYYEGTMDTSYILSKSYSYSYYYPSIRASLLLNHKFNSKNTIRGGVNIDHLAGNMSNFQQNATNSFDTLVSPSAEGYMLQGYIQWKFRPFSRLEINSGMHILESTLNKNVSVEPRFGFKLILSPSTTFIFGFGLHSRSESLAVYNALIKNSSGHRENLNSNLDLSKAMHFVGGLDVSLSSNMRLRFESYIQYLFNIPIVNKYNSQYSTINSAERLPDAVLTNEGTGINKGIELTLERSFIKNYYFLVTGSLFASSYEPGDRRNYNTYYNTKYVSNILFGRDFAVGLDKRNTIGINAKSNFRGGYRFTPVDESRSVKSKRIIYNTVLTYESQLPYFMRIDAGINFRRNHPKYSWIIMLDVQNVTNRKNVFKRRFSFENGKIISSDILSLGVVPVFNFRVEF